MFYDLFIKESLSSDQIKIPQVGGFCFVYENQHKPKQIEASHFYSRINLPFNKSMDSRLMKQNEIYDIVCITEVDNSNISTVIKLEPDLVSLKMESIKHIKKSFINTLKEKNIYVELLLKDTLYNAKDRILWMNSLRRLLKLGCHKNLVISSGASISTELKRPIDICKILALFKLSEDKSRKVLDNSELVLRKAALKRYTYNTVVGNNIEAGSLKKDFIIDDNTKI